MWGGRYNTENKRCNWSGNKYGSGQFGACPDLKEYDDGQDCDPACTLTGGSKSSKNGKCVWPNIN